MDSVTSALMKEFSTANSLLDLELSKQFEHFSAFSVVSSRYSDDFDSADIVVGDGGDLGIDAMAIKVNGRIATDADFVTDILDLNGYLDAEFVIVQSKTSNGFDGSAMISLGDNLVKEFFSEEIKLPKNNSIDKLFETKKAIFDNASKLKGNPVCRVYYVCTGTWNDDDYLVKIIERKRNELLETNLFSNVYFEAIGARQLQDLYRNTKKSIQREIKFEKLVTMPTIDSVSASYLGILPVTEFLKLITDEDGEILKSVFVDNVRDFQGENPVNKDIAKTLQDKLFDQFVLRNNGVTIVSRNVKVTSNQYTLEDYQIVNGCQTSHVIFSNKDHIDGELFVPVKIIHTTSEDVSQSIIRSTNKQTNVEDNDLLALTQFQRDLEDFYSGTPEASRLYYERRAKQYAENLDIEKGRIISIGNQLKSYASMFVGSPHQASRYQGTLLKAVNSQVFQKEHKPEPYYTSALAFYRFNVAFRKATSEEKEFAPFKFFLLWAFRHRYEKFDYPGASNKTIAKYCAALNEHLQDGAKAKDAFEECIQIIKTSLENLNEPLERDSAKLRSVVEEVRKVAIARRPTIPDNPQLPL